MLSKAQGSWEYLSLREEKSDGRNSKNILADAFEAFIAAIYLDKGFDFTFKIVKDIHDRYLF